MDNYPMDRDHLGLAIIISSSVKGKHQKQIDDVTKLEKLFQKLGIQVQTLQWNLDNLRNVSENLSARDLSRYNSLFLCFIVGHLHDDHDVILCPRNLAFDLEALIEDVGKNKSLVGRPKVFLLSHDLKSKFRGRIRFPDIFIGSGPRSCFFDTFCRCTATMFDKKSFVAIFQDVCNSTANDTEDDFVFQSTLRKKLYLLQKGKLAFLSVVISYNYSHEKNFKQ